MIDNIEKLVEHMLAHPSYLSSSVTKCVVGLRRMFPGLTTDDVAHAKALIHYKHPGSVGAYRRHETAAASKSYLPESVQALPRILIFDLETAPLTGYFWKRWKENLSLDQTISEWFLLAWSAKWLYRTEILGDVLTPAEALAQDDSRIVESFWHLIDQADIVIAYNGLKFDVPVINTCFLRHGLNPPSPYQVLDPMLTVKKQLRLSSNKLDSLAMLLGTEVKIGTDFNLWKCCMQGDPEALNYMLKYNKQDVKVLEEVYLKVRPWIIGHPNISLLTDRDDVCPICGSVGPFTPNGYYNTAVSSFPAFQCPHCHGNFRSRKSEGHPLCTPLAR